MMWRTPWTAAGGTIILTDGGGRMNSGKLDPATIEMLFELAKAVIPWMVGLIFAGVIGWKLLSEIIDRWFKKLNKVIENESGYITESRCIICKQNNQKEMEAFKKEVRDGFSKGEVLFGELRGILLVIGTKAGVAVEELKGLTK